MKKPVIGVTPSFDFKEKQLSLPLYYAIAIEEAGGLPIVLPHTGSAETAEGLAEVCDGFIFSGGPDIAPSIFGETPWVFLGDVSPHRDVTDTTYLHAALKTGKPIIAICRGIQLVNAVLGGTLYQDLGSQFPNSEKLHKHRQTEERYVKTHEVTVPAGSVLEKAWGATTFRVNSFHHQAVKDPAPGFEVTAVSDDGVIEGLSNPSYGFFHMVQWHPEMMAPQDEGSKRFFRMFVDACR